MSSSRVLRVKQKMLRRRQANLNRPYYEFFAEKPYYGIRGNKALESGKLFIQHATLSEK